MKEAKDRNLNLTKLHPFVLDVRSDESVKSGRKFVEDRLKSYNGITACAICVSTV